MRRHHVVREAGLAEGFVAVPGALNWLMTASRTAEKQACQSDFVEKYRVSIKYNRRFQAILFIKIDHWTNGMFNNLKIYSVF
ncbi:MAG: hypothetical protein LBD67_09315 [Candidatus Accumulibacter sp.]|jgi:hypothetical protein|nr:hypothetical protein [Accumulibacter sp.]